MNKLLRVLIMLIIFGGITNAQVTVNGGPTITYTSVNAAFAAINNGVHTGAITIDITGNTVEGAVGYLPTPLLASGQSLANYSSIVIRPTVQATISGAPATGRGVLEFDGADNVTINGDIVSGPVQRDLQIENASANNVAATAVIRFIGRTTGGLGSTFNTIENCVLYGNTEGNDGISGSTVVNSYGIYAGTNATNLSTSGTGDNYDNLTISNNEIKRAYIGIWIGGTTANPADDNLIAGNIIGSNTVGETLTYGGIYLNAAVNNTITQNEIFNLKSTTSINNFGIQVGTSSTTSSITISRNKIYTIQELSTGGWGAYGINLYGGNNHLVVNNAIYDIKTVNYSSTSTTYNAFGIRITSGTGHRIYYNSVNLFGQIDQSYSAATSVGSAAMMVTSTACTGLEIKNNIFCNTQTSTVTTVSTKKFMAIWFPSSYNFANAVLDNNAYNVTNDADHFVGKVGTTNNVNEATLLANWKALSQVNNATNDVNSVPLYNFPAPFTSNTNLTFAANTNYAAESGAVIIPALGTNIDINGNIRPLSGFNANTNPDMGAYEFDGLNGFAIDAGITTLAAPTTTGCYSANENVVATIKNFGLNSISNIPVTVIVSGPISQTLTGTYAGPITTGSTFDYTVGTINMLATGVYNFNAYTSLTGDMQTLNDTMATTSRTVAPIVSFPQQVDFTGFTGSNLPTVFPNWHEATGATVPTGTISNWTSQTGLMNATNITARLYLYGTINREWIIGPKFLASANSHISFDAAITANTSSPFTQDAMGSDDAVYVMVSTDCGATYTPIFTITATNSLSPVFTNFDIPLSTYAGQNIIVAFLGSDGVVDDTEAYYFHLDNINLYNASPNDVGVSGITSPGVGCYSSAEPVVVDITNYGTATATNFSVDVWVSGAATQTISNVFTGNLAPAANTSFTVGSLNMSAAGNYTIKAFTTYSGDTNPINDSATVIKTTLPTGSLPQYVNFTGFNSSNLPTFFPDWHEAQGTTVPIGTVSSWVSQTGLNGPTNVSARMYLYGTVGNDWIVGPKVLATSSTNISFDVAITDNVSAPFNPDMMGSDDMLRVYVSTDCGNSFAPIYTISATNSLSTTFSNFVISLAAYSGQEIIVAFQATDGPIDDVEAYYLHLDNINLYNATGTDAGVASFISPGNTCYSSSQAVVVDLKNYGMASISNVPVNVEITGTLNQTLSAIYNGTINPSSSVNFTVGTVNMSAAGTYTLKGYSGISGDGNYYNDTNVVYKTGLAIASLPQSVDFTGYNGSNLTTIFPDWREAMGMTAAGAGTTSSWINATGLGNATNVTARVQLYTNTRNEWILGPRVSATNSTAITFDAAVTDLTTTYGPATMGSDDMVRVMVSTDCGNSYTPIYTLNVSNNLSNTLTNFSVSLAAYAGQDILVGFLATDGPVDDAESYYFHLDNINLYNNSGTDGGVSAILSPTPGECLSSAESIEVTVTNFGMGPITNFPVTAIISGPLNSTVSTNYTGTLAPSTSANFTIGTANMNVSGTYTINAFTGVNGDPNTFNDATNMTFVQTPDFGITGGNVICGSGTETLNITGSASTYTWYNTSNSVSITVSPSVTTTYSAIGTGTNNCQVSAFFTLTVSNPTITGIGATICNTIAVATLSANAFAPINWYATPTSTTILGSGNTYTTMAASTTTYYAEAKSVSNSSLQTLFGSNNSCTGGNMFDITATNGTIVIDSLDVNTTVSASSTLQVIIFYKSGTYIGSETNSSAWTAWDTITATSAGNGNPTRVVFNTPLTIPNNILHSMFVNYSSAYTNGTNAYNNSDLTVQMGAGLCGQFSGVNAGRMFNGNIYYTKPGCTSPKIPVVLTVNPSPTINITPSANTICEGNNVTLTASGADTYTWSTSSTNTVITETPSVTTTYSVDAKSILCPSEVYNSTVTVMVNPLPTVSLTCATNTICSGSGSIALNGTPSGGIYSGTAITGSLLSIANPGTFVPVYSYTDQATGCSNSASTTVYVFNCTGVNNQSAVTSTINIYPNPNNGSFTIDTHDQSIKTVQIVDVTGKVVYAEQTENDKVNIDITEYAKGMYYVILKSKKATNTFKVIKE